VTLGLSCPDHIGSPDSGFSKVSPLLSIKGASRYKCIGYLR
jgi:hypothetical protein